MVEGTIKNLVKTYGFIDQDESQEDVFFLQSWVENIPSSGLREGLRLEYEIQRTEKGLQAVEGTIRVIGEGTQETNHFLNPYNFVRYLGQPRPENHVLGDCPPPPHDRYVGLTGRITCTVDAKTPLFISDSHAIEEDDNEHKSYRFFRYDGKPALPASSLRGMVRSVFEAVTNSCLAIFDSGRRLEYRKPPNYARNLKPGIVRSLPGTDSPGVIQLRDFAKIGAYYRGRKKSRNVLNPDQWQCGEETWARITKAHTSRARVWQLAKTEDGIQDTSQRGQIVKGFLKITGENIPIKRNEYFYYGDKGEITFGAPTMQEYNTVLQGQIEEGLETYQHRRLSPGDLVWVKVEDGSAARICHVRVPRVQYEFPLKKFIKEHLLHCDEFNALCPACRVFGWVRRDTEGIDEDELTAYTGRVRFSHGKTETWEKFEKDIPLAILSTPKPTTTEFYLLNSSGAPDFEVDYDDEDARLRGRKFYRHHGEMLSEKEYRRADDQRDNQNCTVRDALKKGATFTFTVDFENLAPVELGALLYALELEDSLVHRLGYAKPLGFGSVKVTVDRVETVDWPTRLQSLDAEAGWQTVDRAKVDDLKDGFLHTMRALYGHKFDDNVLADLHALLGEPPEGLPVHYPRTDREPDPEGKNYEWFEKHKQVLPLAPEDKSGFSYKT